MERRAFLSVSAATALFGVGCSSGPKNGASITPDNVDRTFAIIHIEEPLNSVDLLKASEDAVDPVIATTPSESIEAKEAPITIRQRSTWCASQKIIAPERADRMCGIHRITIHHDGVDATMLHSIADARRRIQAIQRGHIGRRWADIGYHTMIDPLGNIWQGRPADWQGAHVKHHNEQNFGVAMMGDFNRTQPSEAALASLLKLIRHRMLLDHIKVDGVYTHQEFGRTSCPGKNLQRYMDQIRGADGALHG